MSSNSIQDSREKYALTLKRASEEFGLRGEECEYESTSMFQNHFVLKKKSDSEDPLRIPCSEDYQTLIKHRRFAKLSPFESQCQYTNQQRASPVSYWDEIFPGTRCHNSQKPCTCQVDRVTSKAAQHYDIKILDYSTKTTHPLFQTCEVSNYNTPAKYRYIKTISRNDKHFVSSLSTPGPCTPAGKYNNSRKQNVYKNTNGILPAFPMPRMNDAILDNSLPIDTEINGNVSSEILDSRDLNQDRKPWQSVVEEPNNTPELTNENFNSIGCMEKEACFSKKEHLEDNEKPKTLLGTNAKPVYPFLLGKRGPGQSIPITVKNPFLITSDIRPLKPNCPRSPKTGSECNQSPLQDTTKKNASENISVGLERIFGKKLDAWNRPMTLPTSPMDQNYIIIKSYLKGLGEFVSTRTPVSVAEADVLENCSQKWPIPLNVICNGLKRIEKVGEGVFGEVFLGYFTENDNMRVYKIVPIEGTALVNGEKQKTYSEIFPEIYISKQLSLLNDGFRNCFTDGYIKIYNARVACGKYPEVLLESWRLWDERHDSDNDYPNFPSDQLYLLFEFEHAGQDVESFRFQNAKQAFFLTIQLAHILAVGECAMELEHRDLHWGNILVQRTQSALLTYKLNGKAKTWPSFGIKACVIDFTLARIVDEGHEPIFLDLQNDEEQFLGAGDHQFDIYRMMRDSNRNEWRDFCPQTNIFWIHYLAGKLTTQGRYLESTSMEHRFFLRQLWSLKDTIMQHDSCAKFIFSETCEELMNMEVSSTSAEEKAEPK